MSLLLYDFSPCYAFTTTLGGGNYAGGQFSALLFRLAGVMGAAGEVLNIIQP